MSIRRMSNFLHSEKVTLQDMLSDGKLTEEHYVPVAAIVEVLESLKYSYDPCNDHHTREGTYIIYEVKFSLIKTMDDPLGYDIVFVPVRAPIPKRTSGVYVWCWSPGNEHVSLSIYGRSDNLAVVQLANPDFTNEVRSWSQYVSI
jgi:hypothetical protein